MPPVIDSNRFNAWLSLLVTTAISLAAVLDNSNTVNKHNNETWLITACAICMCFSIIMFASHFVGALSSVVIGEKPEGIIIIACAAIWSGATASIMRPENNVADAGPIIINANLYFFSWGSLFIIIYLLGSYLHDTRMVDSESIKTSLSNTPRLVHWMTLLAASLIAFATAADERDGVCSGQNLGALFTHACGKINYAISYGVIASFFSILAIAGRVTGQITITIETAFAGLVLVLYAIGVAVVTGVGGPGSLVGNLYFSSWIGFLTTLRLATSAVKEFMFGAAGPAGVEREAPAEESADVEEPMGNEEEEDDV